MNLRILTIEACLIFATQLCRGQSDTLQVSSAYTTHLIFSSDITYADLSNPQDIAAKIIEQNRNLLALKARSPFMDSSSVSALESNGNMHTFIVVYEHSPQQLVIDLRENHKGLLSENISGVSIGGKADAPSLQSLNKRKQQLYHIGSKKYKITALCENIVSYSDITYLTISLDNKSSVSYSITDAVFVLESAKKNKRSVSFERTLIPKNRHGSLSADASSSSRITYSFDKMTLAEGQVVKVYFYEQDGQRNLEVTLTARDINNAGKE